MIFLPEAENRTIVSSFIWTKHRKVTTDGQTDDGRTDRIALTITEVYTLHCEQCGRAVKIVPRVHK